jgi:hypothetical protein
MDNTPGLRKRVIALTSKLHVDALEDAHLELGEALGIGVAGLRGEGSDFAEPLRLLRTAIADYVRVVIGGVDKRDPSTGARAELALEPIGRFRALVNAKRGSTGGAGVEEEVDPISAPTPVALPISAPAPLSAPVSAGTFPLAPPAVASPVPENGVGPATP